MVESVASDAERDGLTRSQLQTDVEVRLRKAGIRVLTEGERQDMPGGPYLYVSVNTLKREDGIYVVSIFVDLRQKVFLARKPSFSMYKATWDMSSIGAVGAARLRTVRTGVADIVDTFISDYLAVNPR